MSLILKKNLVNSLCCPVCKSLLTRRADNLECPDQSCQSVFPIVREIPVLINEANSIFQIKDFVENRDTTYRTDGPRWKKGLKNFLPSLGKNYKSSRNFERFAASLKEKNENPKVLILGGAIEGEGLNIENLFGGIEVVESDVSFGKRTNLICDAHDIPFLDETFDGVIIQAVLEHIVDPQKCVAEIHRVLKTGGFVYAETPFMQQVHAGRYDFTRFTHLGHRRLFRRFEEIESGAVCGSGMALAWSYSYFLQSFFESKNLAKAADAFARLTAFWLKYLDYFTIDRAGSFDAASSYYFWGRKSDRFFSDGELIKSYKGLIQ